MKFLSYNYKMLRLSYNNLSFSRNLTIQNHVQQISRDKVVFIGLLFCGHVSVCFTTDNNPSNRCATRQGGIRCWDTPSCSGKQGAWNSNEWTRGNNCTHTRTIFSVLYEFYKDILFLKPTCYNLSAKILRR